MRPFYIVVYRDCFGGTSQTDGALTRHNARMLVAYLRQHQNAAPLYLLHVFPK